ncbi:hypothetical protein [Marinicella litoralis]|uniref:Glutathione synthetase-like protein n=1 Tax=Marinicella litoralis TaxID=644220 RepID=A0A4R6XWK0_9GAMM|nr:hypothetical protein [Marinicella litoralis]TDR22624.1 glutathione synthetase-like protein [Marinicella litoralis]
MKLAIITCEKLPNGVKDDQIFFRALVSMGIEVDLCVWDSQIDWSQYEACVLRSVWDYHEKTEAFTQWLTETSKVTQLINTKDMVLWNQNKYYLAELEQFGITIAPTTWIKKEQDFDLVHWCEAQSATKFFLKPVVGADSSGTFRFQKSNEEINQANNHLQQWLPKVDMMLQPYFNSVETFGETSAIYFGGSLSHAVRKIPVSGDYRVQDTFGAKDIPYTLNAAEMVLAKACLAYLNEKFGEVHYARFDFLHDQEGTVFLNEAELIEPSLFFNHMPSAADNLAQVIYQQLNQSESVEN